MLRMYRWVSWNVVVYSGFTSPRVIVPRPACFCTKSLHFLKFVTERQIPNDMDNSNANANAYGRLLQEMDSRNAASGKALHGHIIRMGFSGHVFVGNNLISYYDRQGDVNSARQAFDEMAARDLFSWNSLIAVYAHNGNMASACNLFNEMPHHHDIVSWNSLISGFVHNAEPRKALAIFQKMRSTAAVSVCVDRVTIASLLKACAALQEGEQGTRIHGLASKLGFAVNDGLVLCALLDMYAKCGMMAQATTLFHGMFMSHSNINININSNSNSNWVVVVWNAMIDAYAHRACFAEAFHLLVSMLRIGFMFSQPTFASVLRGCARSHMLHHGMQVHGHVIKGGFSFDVIVSTAVVDMYAKCGRLESARKVFEFMTTRNVLSWNAVILGYCQNGNCKDALKMFQKMLSADFTPDEVTFSALLSACASLENFGDGVELHSLSIKNGFVSNICVQNALIDMYAKCGDLIAALNVFGGLIVKDTISWNAILSAYICNGHDEEALQLFCEMVKTSIKASHCTFVSVLKSCAALKDLSRAQQIHCSIVKAGFLMDSAVLTALVDNYCKCDPVIDDARKLFDDYAKAKQNIGCWNAIMAGYANAGEEEETFKIFCEMLFLGIEPDEFTFATVVNACASIAAVGLGKQMHSLLVKYQMDVDTFVATALVDMYAKCGNIAGAKEVFDVISDKDLVAWNTLIAGFSQHGQAKKAITIFQQMQENGIQPDHSTFVSVLSACSRAGLLEEGYFYFTSMAQTYNLVPLLEHYACMVNLLGCAGYLDEAMEFINSMPAEPDSVIWRALLSACKLHNNLELGKLAAKHVLELDPADSAAYMLLLHTYAASDLYDAAADIRKLMKQKGLKKEPGCSWVEAEHTVHVFFVADKSHPKTDEIYQNLTELEKQVKDAGYRPNKSLALHDMPDDRKEEILWHHCERLALAFSLIVLPQYSPIQIFENLRICGDCHSLFKFVSKVLDREIMVKDCSRFHNFKGGLCSCGDCW